MIEPTETESKATLDEFVSAMKLIAQEAAESPDRLKTAPTTAWIQRADEGLANRKPNLRWRA